MNVIYPAVLHKDGDAYWIDFPDLEGCQSFGDTAKETVENAREALCLFCTTAIEQKRKLPTPREIDAVETDGGAVVLVESKLDEVERYVKKTLTIPAWLNRAAEEAHLNFSKILREGLEKQIGI